MATTCTQISHPDYDKPRKYGKTGHVWAYNAIGPSGKDYPDWPMHCLHCKTPRLPSTEDLECTESY